MTSRPGVSVSTSRPEQRSPLIRQSADSTTNALIERPTVPKEATTMQLAETTERQGEGASEQQERINLTKARNEYCILISEATDEGFYVEALIDSGSKINIVKKSIYETFFKNNEVSNTVDHARYGGLNNSPLIILGFVEIKIKVNLLAHDTFKVRFAIVPDSTMSYEAILGRDFITQPGLIISLTSEVKMSYVEPGNNMFIIDIEDDINDKERSIEGTYDIGDEVPYMAKTQLTEIIDAYVNNDKETETIDYEMKIEVTSDVPFTYAPRRLSYFERRQVCDIVDDLLERKIIRPSNSPYSSPIVLTKKKNNTYRLCIDYRTLNKITVKDNFPTERIDDQIDELRDQSWFISLDLKDGFYHVPIAVDSIKYTSFVTPDGQYEFLRMPFGLKNGSKAFSRYLREALRRLKSKKTKFRGKLLEYCDDIFIAATTWQDGLDILTEVLNELARYQLQ